MLDYPVVAWHDYLFGVAWAAGFPRPTGSSLAKYSEHAKPASHSAILSVAQNIQITRHQGLISMTKSELIMRLAERNPHLYQRDVEKIVGTIFDEISEALARGDRVELRGFGAFSVKQRDARVGRNPRTGEAVKVEAKHIPFFKTGKQLRERLNTQ